MMKAVLLFLSAVLACSTVYGNTGARDSLFISGCWHSSLGECILPGTTDGNRLGPGNPDTLNTGALTRLYPFFGKVTYTRTVEIPRSFRGKSLRLVLERTKPGVLVIDDVTVGSHSELSVPHVYELPALRPGKHVISLTVDNSAGAVPDEVRSSHAWSESTQTNWNGVIGNMFIEACDPVRISSMDIYPASDGKTAAVKLSIISDRATEADLNLSVSEDSPEGKAVAAVSETASIVKGVNEIEIVVGMGESPKLWSEFHPDLYRFTAVLRAGKFSDSLTEYAGMRTFSTEGTSFTINGFRTFLRGKHDACVFPLTGYPPVDADEWRQVFSKAKEYGINHYRFHSWTPPEAAFEAADREGIYLQIELPLWGAVEREDSLMTDFIRREARAIMDEYGNHPSFVMLSLGNELHGDTSLMREWVEELRRADGRHLYCFGSNNNLGWEGPQDGEDFFVACRVGSGEGYSSHTRTTFAFADAEKGGILNNTRPGTSGNYSSAISKSEVPVISHENCQFQIYPDFSETAKYTGVLYPYNLEIFRDRLAAAGMAAFADEFCRASGNFATECFKADLEYAFRTPGFGGFQMLDLQDYPGQGTALVGVLDAFMESKGVISGDEFRSFCAPVVLLAEFGSYCLSRSDTLDIELKIADYLERDWTGDLSWTLSARDIRSLSGQSVETGLPGISARIPVGIRQGSVSCAGRISLPVEDLASGIPEDAAFCLVLELESGEYSNSYRFWVYPELSGYHDASDGVRIVSAADGRLKELLDAGERVLLVPDHDDVEGSSVGGLFTPDFWNWSMFKRVSERAGKEISPGTLSVVCDPGHPVLACFPNEGHSDWQWWKIALNSRPLIMDALTEYFPAVQVIDNVERCHKLGIVAEFSVGNGAVLLCMTDLEGVSSTPEGAAYRASLINYVSSPDFSPSYRLEWQELLELLYGKHDSVEIEGVENKTDYSRF